ncbi:glycosyltransferase family 4 protein [Acuticoccus yangtzensis]|uniref:glycosyltransferase family 4 protein n=1 Tax=Acuticoccus yangtzensis TaxID=1443441 RepID=UPI0009498CE4|nr:glycosyltransferase family 4 protein [Acuticoccus yangtzensis]
MIAVTHLIDEAADSSVHQMVDHMAACERLKRVARHSVRPLSLGADAPKAIAGRGMLKVDADVIVSHLVISWESLPVLSALRGRYPDTPIVHVEHTYSEAFAAHNIDNHRRFDALMNAAFAMFDQVVAVSRPQAGWLVRKGFAVPDALVMIAPCVDLDPFRGLAAPRRSGPLVVGGIGRLEIQKGFDILVRAVRELQVDQVRLNIFGKGSEEPLLRQLAGDRPDISFHAPTADSAAIGTCDVIALPSRWEPFGVVALKAFAAGRTIMCPRTDGLSDHIANGAIRVLSNTVAGWADALSTMSITGAAVPGPLAPDAAARFAADWNGLLLRMQNGAEGFMAPIRTGHTGARTLH